MTLQERVKRQATYWTETAWHDWRTAQSLWKSRRYDACLFFCHLVLEKILKAAVVVKTRQDAPRIHDLMRLSAIADLILDERKQNMLIDINHFNIAGRYPAD